MSVSQPTGKAIYTYQDYLGWPDEERWEIIEGVPYAMTPAPSPRHQQIVVELSRQISNYLVGKPCRVFVAPFDLRLSEPGTSDLAAATVVQPDVLVFCDPSLVDERGGRGAPDWVLEVLSDSTAAHDLTVKLNLYERFGIPEYWVVHPRDKLVMIFRMGSERRYRRPEVLTAQDRAVPSRFADLAVDLSLVLGME